MCCCTATAKRLERGEVDIEQLGRLDELSAGMPAAVLTIDGERIGSTILVQPLEDSFRRAWRVR